MNRRKPLPKYRGRNTRRQNYLRLNTAGNMEVIAWVQRVRQSAPLKAAVIAACKKSSQEGKAPRDRLCVCSTGDKTSVFKGHLKEAGWRNVRGQKFRGPASSPGLASTAIVNAGDVLTVWSSSLGGGRYLISAELHRSLRARDISLKVLANGVHEWTRRGEDRLIASMLFTALAEYERGTHQPGSAL